MKNEFEHNDLTKRIPKDNDKKWILYITIPLLLIVLIICGTIIYLNINPYPLNIGFTMDNNTLEAIKLMQLNLTNTTL